MARENKYPNGYWPKINFWLGALEEASETSKYSVEYCIGKLKYFTQKQQELGAITDFGKEDPQ